MKKAGEFIAMLVRRWGSKTPERAKWTQVAIGILGTGAVVILSVPSLGLPVWASIGVGLVAATAMSYEQVKDESTKTIQEETREIYPRKVKHK